MTVLRDLRLGATRVGFREDDPLEHPREAMYVSVNARGVMASGLAGALRLAAGSDLERELRSRGELLVGTACLLAPGRLAERGVVTVACGITTTAPGSPPKRVAVEHAFTKALDLLNMTSARSLTIPEIGIRVPGIEFSDAAGILALILSARIRQGTRLHEVVIAGLHHEYLRQCHALLIRAGATAE